MTYGIKNVIKDALTGNLQFVSAEVAAKRMALCQVCPYRRENIPGRKEKHDEKIAKHPWSIEKDKCDRCGCYMPVKTKLAEASCPARKW